MPGARSRSRPARRPVHRLEVVVRSAEGEHVLDTVDARYLHLTQLHAGSVSPRLEILVDEKLVERVHVRVSGVLGNLHEDNDRSHQTTGGEGRQYLLTSTRALIDPMGVMVHRHSYISYYLFPFTVNDLVIP